MKRTSHQATTPSPVLVLTRIWLIASVGYVCLNGLVAAWLSWFAWPWLSSEAFAGEEYFARLFQYMGWLRCMILQGGAAFLVYGAAALTLVNTVKGERLAGGVLLVAASGFANVLLFFWDASGMGV